MSFLASLLSDAFYFRGNSLVIENFMIHGILGVFSPLCLVVINYRVGIGFV